MKCEFVSCFRSAVIAVRAIAIWDGRRHILLGCDKHKKGTDNKDWKYETLSEEEFHIHIVHNL